MSNVQSHIKLKTKVIETLQKFAEMNGDNDNGYISLHELETLRLKQSENASKEPKMQDFVEKWPICYSL